MYILVRLLFHAEVKYLILVTNSHSSIFNFTFLILNQRSCISFQVCVRSSEKAYVIIFILRWWVNLIRLLQNSVFCTFGSKWTLTVNTVLEYGYGINYVRKKIQSYLFMDAVTSDHVIKWEFVSNFVSHNYHE